MNAQKWAIQLKGIIEDLKNKGSSSIDSDALIKYLDSISKIQTTENNPDILGYQNDLQLKQFESQTKFNLEMFRSVIQSGQNAIRTSFLMNGGASISLLAFIGHLAVHKPQTVTLFSNALIPFVLGVLAMTIASGSTYLSQYLYEDPSPKTQKVGFGFNLLSIALGLSSYVFFVWGMYRAVTAFGNFI